MAFSPVDWAYKEEATSVKLDQMVENTRVHDHRADGSQGAAFPVLRFDGSETAPIGTSPGAGQLVRFRAASVVVVVGVNGIFSLPWPGGAFPNGIVSWNAVTGDNAGAASQITPLLAGSTLSALQAVARTGTGAVVANGASVRVNVQVWGW